MPLKYTIYPDRRLVHVRGEGTVTVQEILQNLHDLSADADYVPPMKKLVDYRRCAVMDLSVADIDIFTESKRSMQEDFAGEKCAIVVLHDVDYGMSRVHAARIDNTDIETRSFRDLDAALAWLQAALDDAEREPD